MKLFASVSFCQPTFILRSLVREEGGGEKFQKIDVFDRDLSIVEPLFKDVRAKNFYNTDFFHSLETVR